MRIIIVLDKKKTTPTKFSKNPQKHFMNINKVQNVWIPFWQTANVKLNFWLFQGPLCYDHTESLLEDLKGKESDSDEAEALKKIENVRHDDDDNFDEEKCRRLLSFEEAPEYLKHNIYILTGYRGILNTKLCIER